MDKDPDFCSKKYAEKYERLSTSLSGPHGVDLRDHVAIVLAAHEHIVAAPEGDGPGDGVLLPVDQALVRPLRPLGAYKWAQGISTQCSGSKAGVPDP